MSVPNNLNTLNYPITTELQKKFWASRHKCNNLKSIIAFSLDLDNANDNLRRYGYKRAWRKRAILSFGQYVNQYTMISVPYSNSLPWWEEMPAVPASIDPSVAAWLASKNWDNPTT